MDDLNLVFVLLGVASSIIGIVAIFLMPLEHIKVYAAALGMFAAVVVCLLPIRIAGYDGKGEIDCGSVLRPGSIPGDDAAAPAFTAAELINAGLRGIEREALTKTCHDRRRGAIYMALLIGFFSLVVFVENMVKVRRAIGPKAG